MNPVSLLSCNSIFFLKIAISSFSFEILEDPRIDRHKRYPLINILVFAFMAILSDQQSFYQIHAFCAANIDWFAKYINISTGMRSAFTKSTAGSGKDMDELNTALQQIVSRAVASTEMVDIFAVASLKNPEISILSDEFLAEVKGMERKNLAFEM